MVRKSLSHADLLSLISTTGGLLTEAGHARLLLIAGRSMNLTTSLLNSLALGIATTGHHHNSLRVNLHQQLVHHV